MLEKGAILKVGSTHKRAISEQPLPCREKEWRKPPSDKFKKSQQIHSLRAFQNGRSALSEVPSRTGRFAIQDRYEAGIFFSFPQQKLSKVCQISMVRQPIRISLSMLGLRPAPRIFTKLLKVPIALLRRVNIRIIIYLDDMLLMGRTLPEILMARDTLIFLLQHLGFVINLKKSVLHPVKQIEFLGLVIDTEKMTFAFTEKKLKHVSQ